MGWFCVVGLGVCRLGVCRLVGASLYCVLSALRNGFELSVIFSERHFLVCALFLCALFYIVVVLNGCLC